MVGLYLKSTVMGTPRPVQQALPVESNNARPETEPALYVAHHAPPTESHERAVAGGATEAQNLTAGAGQAAAPTRTLVAAGDVYEFL